MDYHEECYQEKKNHRIVHADILKESIKYFGFHQKKKKKKKKKKIIAFFMPKKRKKKKNILNLTKKKKKKKKMNTFLTNTSIHCSI